MADGINGNVLATARHASSVTSPPTSKPPFSKPLPIYQQIMQFSSITSAAILGFASLASAITVSYDTGYDDGSRALTSLACSDGSNGLITKYNWQTQANVAGFPKIGGYMGVAGWNSPQVRTLTTFPHLHCLIIHTSVVHATALPTTERPSTFSPSTMLLKASTSPRQPWTSLQTARLRLWDVSMPSTLRSLLVTAGYKHCALLQTMMIGEGGSRETSDNVYLQDSG